MRLGGPHRIIECPKCKKLARTFTLLSGNTFGARFWTDAKLDAPMLPEQTPIIKCTGCNQYFWISEARIGLLPFTESKEDIMSAHHEGQNRYEDRYMHHWLRGTEAEYTIPNEWKTAEKVPEELSEEGYFEAINLNAFSDIKQEKILRLKAWQASNDRFRLPRESAVYKPQATPLHSAQAKANIERLAEILDINESSERLLKAEAKRELGLFDEAVELLNFNFLDKEKHASDFIKFIAEHHDCVVREIG